MCLRIAPNHNHIFLEPLTPVSLLELRRHNSL